MIPIIPLFLVLLSPLLAFWHQQRSYWRLGYFFGINAVLLIAIVTQVPQIAIIRLVQAVEGVPQIRRVISLEDSVALFPAAYGLRAREIEIARTTSEALLSDPTFKCDEPIVVRADKKQRVWAARPRFQVVQTLSPGWIEQILVKTNPGRNLRRGPLEIWLPADCPNPF